MGGVNNMNLQHKTIGYHLQEALAYLKRLYKACKNESLTEGEFLPEMEHILWHLNFSFNARYLSRKKAASLNRAKYKQYILPPLEIFKSIKKRKKSIKSKT